MFYKVLGFFLLSFILSSCTGSTFNRYDQIIKVQIYNDSELVQEYLTDKDFSINGLNVFIDEKIVLTRMK